MYPEITTAMFRLAMANNPVSYRLQNARARRTQIAVIRQGRKPLYSVAHDLAVQKALLELCGML